MMEKSPGASGCMAGCTDYVLGLAVGFLANTCGANRLLAKTVEHTSNITQEGARAAMQRLAPYAGIPDGDLLLGPITVSKHRRCAAGVNIVVSKIDEGGNLSTAFISHTSAEKNMPYRLAQPQGYFQPRPPNEQFSLSTQQTFNPSHDDSLESAVERILKEKVGIKIPMGPRFELLGIASGKGTNPVIPTPAGVYHVHLN